MNKSVHFSGKSAFPPATYPKTGEHQTWWFQF